MLKFENIECHRQQPHTYIWKYEKQYYTLNIFEYIQRCQTLSKLCLNNVKNNYKVLNGENYDFNYYFAKGIIKYNKKENPNRNKSSKNI